MALKIWLVRFEYASLLGDIRRSDSLSMYWNKFIGQKIVEKALFFPDLRKVYPKLFLEDY